LERADGIAGSEPPSSNAPPTLRRSTTPRADARSCKSLGTPKRRRSWSEEESSLAARERVLNALELPGEVLDYHFALQGVAEMLHRRRRTESEVLPFVEWLCWLDARLANAHERYFRVTPESDQYLSIFAFRFLVNLHTTEGYLHEGLALAEAFARFMPEELSELRGRVARLREEHG
jgi:hypothetical protein